MASLYIRDQKEPAMTPVDFKYCQYAVSYFFLLRYMDMQQVQLAMDYLTPRANRTGEAILP